MIFQDVNWMRGYGTKMCPELRKRVLDCYRPARLTPCFLQKSIGKLTRRWKKVPIIVQLEKYAVHAMSTHSLAEEIGCKLKKNLQVIDAFASEVTTEQLEKLLRNKNVKKIWHDGEVHAVLDAASPTVGAPGLWDEGYTGKGIVIAVLDTGIYNHPDLQNRILDFKDLINDNTNPYDDNGHGTHVAGCAAASGSESNGKYKGPAPEAGLVGVKVLNKSGSGSLSTVIEGIGWCVQNKERLSIRIINLSLGSNAYQSHRDDPVCQAAVRAWEAGIVVCAAAGNSGPQPRTINSPAIEPGILTVGAINDRNPDEDGFIAEFSSRGPTIDGLVKPDVCAPGVQITALRSPGSTIDKQNKDARVDNWHTSLSGTSMATPVCAGVIAQLLQQDPFLSPDEIKNLLMETAKPLTGYGENDQGAGVVNAHQASQTP
ncbi:S8 family peptidase [Dethiobacter alkaliphilus]|uniref:S8 family peptidase n=1 Tax=Dethiobacter alkaliphilus TaxID=427926 RepID=UPI002227A5E3|nr:S8 family peptidase [Dethiobacter alkaliphilus]MCW3489676.1 S8 family peptidase [Dethiobacter alkaliphilus]